MPDRTGLPVLEGDAAVRGCPRVELSGAVSEPPGSEFPGSCSSSSLLPEMQRGGFARRVRAGSGLWSGARHPRARREHPLLGAGG